MAENHKPTEGMIAEANRGLEWRREFGRGGTSVGIARARDISNGKSLPLATVKRMKSFFARHEVDKKAKDSDQAKKVIQVMAESLGLCGVGMLEKVGQKKS